MSEENLQLTVIIGSSREGRTGPAVARWFVAEAESCAMFDVDVLDLAGVELPLSLTQDPGSESAELLAAVGARLESADAFVVITPEYNHSFTAPMKNLIDWHRTPWQAKPIGFVSYGGLSGGLRAVEQLRQVFAELHAATIRDTVSFHGVWQHVGEDGVLRAPDAAVPAKVMLEKLQWWAAALKDARTLRPYAA
ncbi:MULTISPECIES: NADPH-dependent FMN reductase [Streptomyces]|uniref:NADPH-dependent FMN reductase n=2 Tax=Streptomyces TaxID=1883 RepID=A0A2U9P0Z9_STRAS|nr:MULTISPECIES: NAD(P)H-dependent oxidoreductase [Streptomyces]AWT42934.1 NADPH-dependent FMN reductase [Streptomyces actuosus]MBM4824941.1 NAD(P)H-dependent oxidoreductase [Streptomyces actuosus]GHF71635.1 putative reductase [Streptomyces griseosporeus]